MQTQSPTVTGNPRLLLRAEGAAIAFATIITYWQMSFSWSLFALLILAPDIFMLGYLMNKRIGAWAYNIAHSYSLPILLFIGYPATTPVVLIWLAHIGIDRMVGYGLKYDTDFKDTHLSRNPKA